jgi:hypothetical protein
MVLPLIVISNCSNGAISTNKIAQNNETDILLNVALNPNDQIFSFKACELY